MVYMVSPWIPLWVLTAYDVMLPGGTRTSLVPCTTAFSSASSAWLTAPLADVWLPNRWLIPSGPLKMWNGKSEELPRVDAITSLCSVFNIFRSCRRELEYNAHTQCHNGAGWLKIIYSWCFYFVCLELCFTVKPVLRDHCHDRQSVLKDHILLAEGPTFHCNWTFQQRPPVLRDHIFFMDNGAVFQGRFYCTPQRCFWGISS